MQKRRVQLKAETGFTLVELLVVIGITGVLMAVIFSAASKARDRALLMGCQTRLRHIGTAVQAYAADHKGLLPGPLKRGQAALHDGHSARLLSYIAAYMGISETPTDRVEESFCCPAWLKKTPNRQDTVWWLNMEMMSVAGERIDPWGYHHNDPEKRALESPLRTFTIQYPEQTMMLMDLDQTIGAPWPGAPAVPHHGKVRNFLFMDGHVSTEPLTVVPTVGVPPGTKILE